MEDNSNNESQAQPSFQLPPVRRRSTFFDRRNSIAPEPTTENTKIENCQDKTEALRPNIQNEEENEKRLSNLSSYYNQLHAEKVAWKNETIERRNKYHDWRKVCEMATGSSSASRMSYSTLTDEDIEFLRGKPNIRKLYESQQKLQKSVMETISLVRMANQLDDYMLSCCENKVNNINKNALEYSAMKFPKD